MVEEAYLKIVTKILDLFPILATHLKRNKNIFHLAADEGRSEVIMTAKQSISNQDLLSQALLQKDSGNNTPLAIAVRVQGFGHSQRTR